MLKLRVVYYCYILIILLNAMSVLKVKRLSENSFVPTLGSNHSAGYDLYSAYDYVVPARDRCLIKTDIAISIPDDCYARVASRSGLAVKFGIDVGAGVIDKDYVGNIGAVLFNHTDLDFIVKKGDRIAQLILEKIHYATVTVVDTLEETDRGANGFGSTG